MAFGLGSHADIDANLQYVNLRAEISLSHFMSAHVALRSISFSQDLDDAKHLMHRPAVTWLCVPALAKYAKRLQVCWCRHAVGLGPVVDPGLGGKRRPRRLLARAQPALCLGGAHEAAPGEGVSGEGLS